MNRCPEELTRQTQEAINEARSLAEQLNDTLDRLDDYVRQQSAGEPRD